MTALSLPGRDTENGARILKVDHAGEHGAVQIYSAQLMVARWTAPQLLPLLREFRAHEAGHRASFEAELLRRGVPRCRSFALCALGGWTLGFITALCGRSAIAATTVAVERVVLRHLVQQMAVLQDVDPAAHQAVAAIVAEEQAHHDELAQHLPRSRFLTATLDRVVVASTEAVIWLGMKL